ncbi:MAG: hypothetical protein AAGD13_15815 [Pseudomonadota bacterium]
MKLSGRDAIDYCRRPDTAHDATLIFGPDLGFVTALKDQLVAARLVGMAGETEIVDLAPDEVRRDPLKLGDALQAQGLFASERIVLIQNATDALTKPIAPALDQDGALESPLIITAGALAGRSSLRMLFESRRSSAVLQTFEAVIDEQRVLEGIRAIDPDLEIPQDDLYGLVQFARGMDYAGFLKAIELIALYGAGRSEPLTLNEILKLLPQDQDAEIDSVVTAIAEGHADRIGPTLRRLAAAGVTPVSLVLALQRHFRMLFAIASAGGNLSAVRPPLWGPRRDSVQRQVSRWPAGRIEAANSLLLETDAAIRSSGRPPEFALIERCALRLAMMVRR